MSQKGLGTDLLMRVGLRWAWLGRGGVDEEKEKGRGWEGEGRKDGEGELECVSLEEASRREIGESSRLCPVFNLRYWS